MNVLDILLSAVILAVLAAAVSYFAGKNRQDSGSCSGDCVNCVKSCEDRQDSMH